MTRFWLRPKWVVGHVLVVVLVVLFVGLGLWQLRRLDDRRAVNAAVEDRGARPAVTLDELVAADAPLDAVDDLEYRRVTVTGTYDTGSEVLVRSRSLNGQPGYHVVTPLVTGDGTAVLVNRGFAPLALEDPSRVLAAAAPPAGPVTVTGLVRPTEERRGIGPTDAPDGTLDQVNRVDIGRLQQQYGRDLYPVHVQLEGQDPAPADGLPVVLPAPDLGEGNHLSYAVQWFLFAVVGVVGWPVLLRHTARERRGGGPPAATPEGAGAAGDGETELATIPR